MTKPIKIDGCLLDWREGPAFELPVPEAVVIMRKRIEQVKACGQVVCGLPTCDVESFFNEEVLVTNFPSGYPACYPRRLGGP